MWPALNKIKSVELLLYIALLVLHCSLLEERQFPLQFIFCLFWNEFEIPRQLYKYIHLLFSNAPYKRRRFMVENTFMQFETLTLQLSLIDVINLNNKNFERCNIP